MKPEVPSQSKKKKRLSIDPATVSQKLYERDLAAAGYERTGDLFIIDPYKGGYINMTARYREARVFNKEKRRLKLLQKNSAAENSKPAAKKSKPAAKKSKPAAKKSKPAAKKLATPTKATSKKTTKKSPQKKGKPNTGRG